MGSGNPNTDPHTWTESALPTEPSSWSLFCSDRKQMDTVGSLAQTAHSLGDSGKSAAVLVIVSQSVEVDLRRS